VAMERWDKITMEQVSKLIEANKYLALQLDVKLSFGVTNKKFYGAIFNADQQVFYKTYSGEYAHIIVAQIHIDLSEHLKKIDVARKRAESVRLQMERNAEREKMQEEAWQKEVERRKQNLMK